MILGRVPMTNVRLGAPLIRRENGEVVANSALYVKCPEALRPMALVRGKRQHEVSC